MEQGRKHKVKRICAWCGKRLEDAFWDKPITADITHTMCDDCSEKSKEELKKFKKNQRGI